MARLARGQIRHERYQQCLQLVGLAVLCALAGDDDMFLVMAGLSVLQLQEYEQLVAPTTLEGVCPTHDYMEVIGGFDFKELFRFEKPHFLLLLAELQLPEFIEIYR